MFYFQQPVYQQRRPQLSVDDYVQLQLLLRQEQAQREQAALYRKQQEEQRRLEKALYNLKVMTELQRRREQEELAIEAYFAAKKRRQQQEQALLHYRRQQQQEAYYNAMLEQQYHLCTMALEQQQAVKSAKYANPYHAMATTVASTMAAEQEEVSDSDSDADQEEHVVSEQLESLVRFIFGQPDDQDKQEKQEREKLAQESEQTMSLDEFVGYISQKAQELDDQDNNNKEEPQEIEDNQDDAMEEDDQDLTVSALKHIDDNEEEKEVDSAMEQDEEVPPLVKSTESLQHLVNDILTNTASQDEPFSVFPEEDPVKIAKFEALARIEQELNEIRQQHEDHVLHAALDFSLTTDSGHPTSPDTISASTAENREFLSYEDQIVKVLLKLDTIESDGDEQIRNERKALVKRAEFMLGKLDEYKQKEWERVSCSSHSDNEDVDEEYIAVL